MKERCNTCFEVLTTLFPHICCLLLSFCKFVFYNHSAMLILCDLFWFCPYCSYCMTSSHLCNSSSGSSVAMEVQSSGVALNSGIYLVSELGFAVFFHSCQGGSVSGSWQSYLSLDCLLCEQDLEMTPLSSSFGVIFCKNLNICLPSKSRNNSFVGVFFFLSG